MNRLIVILISITRLCLTVTYLDSTNLSDRRDLRLLLNNDLIITCRLRRLLRVDLMYVAGLLNLLIVICVMVTCAGAGAALSCLGRIINNVAGINTRASTVRRNALTARVRLDNCRLVLSTILSNYGTIRD